MVVYTKSSTFSIEKQFGCQMNVVESQMLQNSTMHCRRRRITIFIHVDPEEDGESRVKKYPLFTCLRRDANLLWSGEVQLLFKTKLVIAIRWKNEMFAIETTCHDQRIVDHAYHLYPKSSLFLDQRWSSLTGFSCRAIDNALCLSQRVPRKRTNA